MDHLAEILTYLLQRQEGGDFSAEKEEIDRAERAILLERIGAVLEEEGLSDETRLTQIIMLLEDMRQGKSP